MIRPLLGSIMRLISRSVVLFPAGRTDEHEDLAGRDVEREIGDRGDVGSRVHLGHVLEADHRGRGARRCSRRRWAASIVVTPSAPSAWWRGAAR
jgi:hypothetical protein